MRFRSRSATAASRRRTSSGLPAASATAPEDGALPADDHPPLPPGVQPPPRLDRGQLLFRTLGVAEIHIGGVGVISPGAERMFSLLALTAMAPDHVLAREEVLALVWPESDDESARHSLRQHLYKLRHWGVPLRSTRASVMLDPSCLLPCFALDRTARRFDADVLRGGEPFGQLFAGWIPSHLAMRRWVEEQRDRFQMDVRRILVPELRRLRDRADWVECERWARTVLEFDPYNEDGMLVLAEAIAMQGSRFSARTMLDGYVRETGMAGTDLAQDVEAAQRRIGKATRVRHEAAATPTLVGRDEELRKLDAITLAALQGQTQVVQITGPAGIGKTELAYEATRRAVILGFTRCIVRVTRPMGQMPLGMLSRLVRDLLRLPGALGCRPEHLSLLTAISQEPLKIDEVVAEHLASTSLTEALHELVASVAEESALFVLLDDVHFADAASMSYLVRSMTLFRRERLLLLSTAHRPESTLGNEEALFVLPLGPLSLPAAIELAGSVRSATGRALKQVDAERVALASAGIPIEIIAGARNELVLGLTPLAEERHRDGVRVQVASRSRHARLILQVIALFGGRIKGSLLDHLVELTLPERVEAIRELLHTGLLQEAIDGEVSIHSWVAEASLSILTPTERHAIQRSVLRNSVALPQPLISTSFALSAIELATAVHDGELKLQAAEKLVPRLFADGLSGLTLPFLEECYRHSSDTSSRSELLVQIVAASANQADWQRVLGGTAELRDITSPKAAVSAAVRIAEIEAIIRQDTNEGAISLATEAAEIAAASDCSVDDCLHASRVAIGAASDLFLPAIASKAMQTLIAAQLRSDCDDLQSIESAMQYETIFGSLDTASEIAARALPLLERGDLTVQESRYALNAAYVMRVAGELEIAERMFVVLREASSVSSILARRAFATWQLALMALDRDDVKSAEYWSRSLEEVHASSHVEPWYALHRQRMLLVTGASGIDWSLVEALANGVHQTPTRRSAYALGILLSPKRPIHFSALDEYIATGVLTVRRCAPFVGQDLLVTSVSSQLWIRGEEDYAASLLSEYLTQQRRERFAAVSILNHLPSALQRRIVPKS